MALQDVIGNELIIDRMRKSIAKNSVSHAYILEGARGIGKRFLADNFAKSILCKESEDACESCLCCQKINHLNHEDILYIQPEGASIKDEVIEDMQHMLRKKPLSADRNIIIIEKAELLTKRAQNRLLKTLEEPTGQAVIMLLTENAGSLTETIISRCILFKMRPATKEQVTQYIRAQFPELSPDKIASIAAFSYGLIGKARNLLDEAVDNMMCDAIKFAESLLNGKAFYEIVKETESFISKENALDFFDLVQYWLRDILMWKYCEDKEEILYADYKDQLEASANKYDAEKIRKLILGFEQVKSDMAMKVNFNYALKNMILKA